MKIGHHAIPVLPSSRAIEKLFCSLPKPGIASSIPIVSISHHRIRTDSHRFPGPIYNGLKITVQKKAHDESVMFPCRDPSARPLKSIQKVYQLYLYTGFQDAKTSGE